MKEILTFDEMYRMECDYRNIEGVYQVYADINPYRLMKQIKAEREYLINELVDVSLTSVIDLSKEVKLDDLEELKMTIRYEILEELQLKYDEFLSKYKENK